MNRFTTDNTDGYNEAQLFELNRRFTVAMAQSSVSPEDDDVYKSVCDHVAETILAKFDNEPAPAI